MTLVDKIKALTPKQFVMAMVDGLRARYAIVDMGSYGYIEDGLCYGCAATNAIAKVNGSLYPIDEVKINVNHFRTSFDWYHATISNDPGNESFIVTIEQAYNCLRVADIFMCNFYLDRVGLFNLNYEMLSLVHLHNDYTEEDLQTYVDYANSQEVPQ
jgi:hypothetical protein